MPKVISIREENSEEKKLREWFKAQSLETPKNLEEAAKAASLSNLAQAFLTQGDLDRAISLYEESLKLDKQFGYKPGQAASLNSMAQIFLTRGNLDRTAELYEEQLTILQEIDNRYGVGVTLENLGLVYADLKEIDRAVSFFARALTIYREIGDRRGEGNVLVNLAGAYVVLGEARKAIETFTLSLEIAHEIGDHRSEASIRNKLVSAFGLDENAILAINSYLQILQIGDNLKGRLGKIDVEPRLLRVFLCYSSRDKTFVQELYERLNKYGIDVWMDNKKIFPGQDWEYEIEHAIDSSDVIIICLSTKSVASESYVHKEIKNALVRADKMPEGRIFIIPCRLDDVAIPSQLRKYQWVDFLSPDGFDKMIQSLRIIAAEIPVVLKQ